ncbi:hypothetical protein PENTCL1PPCAC_19210, partial [Pristionchus entomophagus]
SVMGRNKEKKEERKAEKNQRNRHVFDSIRDARDWVQQGSNELQARLAALGPPGTLTEGAVRGVTCHLRAAMHVIFNSILDPLYSNNDELKIEKVRTMIRLQAMAKEFEKKDHTAESIEDEVKVANRELMEMLQVCCVPSVDCSNIQQEMQKRIQEIEGRDPFHEEKAELKMKLERLDKAFNEKMEELKKKEMERKAMENEKKEGQRFHQELLRTNHEYRNMIDYRPHVDKHEALVRAKYEKKKMERKEAKEKEKKKKKKASNII